MVNSVLVGFFGLVWILWFGERKREEVVVCVGVFCTCVPTKCLCVAGQQLFLAEYIVIVLGFDLKRKNCYGLCKRWGFTWVLFVLWHQKKARKACVLACAKDTE